MVKQYPHILKIKFSNFVNDTKGVIEKPCRLEKSSGTIKGFNRNEEAYKSIIYLPKDSLVKVDQSTQVDVYEDDILIVSDIAKQFSNGQLNQRIWI